MSEYNPREVFEKVKCKIECPDYYEKCSPKGCYVEYLEEQNKLLLEVLENIRHSYSASYSRRISKKMIESITGKSIEEAIK